MEVLAFVDDAVHFLEELVADADFSADLVGVSAHQRVQFVNEDDGWFALDWQILRAEPNSLATFCSASPSHLDMMDAASIE